MPLVFEDPEGYMRDFQARMQSIVSKASSLNEAMEAASATASSPEGEVTVRVGVGGTLQDLEFRGGGQKPTTPTIGTAASPARSPTLGLRR